MTLTVGLDLDGSLESLGNSMIDLADALAATNECALVRFRTASRPRGSDEASLRGRWLWAPLWRYGRGPSLERLLAPLDVVHVAGVMIPPPRRVPVVVSVDDLRPLRSESRVHQRVVQLRRAASRGATLVASSRAASHEVRDVLGVGRARVVVVPPAVPVVARTEDGRDLVVNVTGAAANLLAVIDGLVALASARGARVLVIASESVGQRVRARGLALAVRSRRDAREALGVARVVVHLSDGARFPSFALAALAAGVPTVARATPSTRELLEGAAVLVDGDDELVGAVAEAWDSEARRAILVAAGLARARDFAPASAARSYLALYREVVEGAA